MSIWSRPCISSLSTTTTIQAATSNSQRQLSCSTATTISTDTATGARAKAAATRATATAHKSIHSSPGSSCPSSHFSSYPSYPYYFTSTSNSIDFCSDYHQEDSCAFQPLPRLLFEDNQSTLSTQLRLWSFLLTTAIWHQQEWH